MSGSWHPLVKRLLDGELSVTDLPPALREEGERALAMLRVAADRTPSTLSSEFEIRVMTIVQRRAKSRRLRIWHWLDRPREVRLRVRPWMLGPVLAAAAALVVLLGGPSGGRGRLAGEHSDSVYVRFVLYAPGAQRVTLAGTFNEWDPAATPLTPGGEGDVWLTTLALPVGEYQYAFVVDGRRWLADPAAPRVDDGFGRANSFLSVRREGRTL